MNRGRDLKLLKICEADVHQRFSRVVGVGDIDAVQAVRVLGPGTASVHAGQADNSGCNSALVNPVGHAGGLLSFDKRPDISRAGQIVHALPIKDGSVGGAPLIKRPSFPADGRASILIRGRLFHSGVDETGSIVFNGQASHDQGSVSYLGEFDLVIAWRKRQNAVGSGAVSRGIDYVSSIRRTYKYPDPFEGFRVRRVGYTSGDQPGRALGVARQEMDEQDKNGGKGSQAAPCL